MGTQGYDEPNAFTTYGNSYLWPRVDTKDRADYASVGGAVTAGALGAVILFLGLLAATSSAANIKLDLPSALAGAVIFGFLSAWIVKRPGVVNNGLALALCLPLWVATWELGFLPWFGVLVGVGAFFKTMLISLLAVVLSVLLTAGALGGLRACLELRKFEP